MHREKKVLIVEDSALMGKVLTDILSRVRNLKVLGVARDSREGWEMVQRLSPDVITLDLMLPDGSGLDLLKRIMREKPTPVVVVSSLTKKTAQETFKAYELGAVDVIEKPGNVLSNLSSISLSNLGYRVIKASDTNIKALSWIIGDKVEYSVKEDAKRPQTGSPAKSVVLVASSTGGPQVLTKIFENLTTIGDACMIVVQHMPPMFTNSLAGRLDRSSPLTVKEAADGDKLVQGVAYIAPGGVHLELQPDGKGGMVLRTTNGPMVHGVKPSADVTFASFSKVCKLPMIGVVLTGMGSDGADGCRLIKEIGARIISQSKETCIVYGMPKSVEERGLSDAVLPHTEIPIEVMRWIKSAQEVRS